MLNLVDYYGGTFIIFIFVLFEVIGVAWVYGIIVTLPRNPNSYTCV